MFLAIEKELLSLKTNYKPNYYLLIFTPLHLHAWALYRIY